MSDIYDVAGAHIPGAMPAADGDLAGQPEEERASLGEAHSRGLTRQHVPALLVLYRVPVGAAREDSRVRRIEIERGERPKEEIAALLAVVRLRRQRHAHKAVLELETFAGYLDVHVLLQRMVGLRFETEEAAWPVPDHQTPATHVCHEDLRTRARRL